ncbi:hypothetical protein [Thermomonospora umbrina]|uniref:hypothetical protein n=1 Tax=Thermomonospora umbrina TaxID=111806 RepID=UPI001FE39AED|nr:hypothetical protein [Thermomonospora umbrina]
MKVLIGAVAAAIVVAVGVTVGYFVLFDDEELRYKTQRALRNAMPALAAAELKARGHSLSGELDCRDLQGWTKRKLRVRCAGTTSTGKPVEVIGAAEDATRREFFTVLVDGRPVVQNVPCLGADCRADD